MSAKGNNRQDHLNFTPAVSSIDKPYKTIRVAVSGDVILSKLEVKIIDTESFQRLRKFRQLGTSYLIYPSAHHTRFEHSLGVLNVVKKMMDSIKSNVHSEKWEREITNVQKRLARLAALLHDIANIPFGHTLEDETNVVNTNQEDRSRFLQWIGEDTEIGKVLIQNIGKKDTELLLDILTAQKDPDDEKMKKENTKYISDLKDNAFITDLIKNTVCADLLDYLARDTYFCGLPLSIPDRFLSYLYIHNSDGVKRIAIRLWKESKDHRPRTAIISELIQLLEIRYFLAERVYFHHTKQISSAMIASAVFHALNQEKNKLSLKKLYKLGDDDLLNVLKDKKYPVASKLTEKISKRRLYKRFFSVQRAKIEANRLHDYLGDLRSCYHLDAIKKAECEKQLCDLAGLELGDVVIYCPDPEMNLKIAKMLVTSRKGGIEPFSATDDRLTRIKMESILESHRNLWELQVFIDPDVEKSENKRQLLYQICNMFFEPPINSTLSESNEKIALSAVIDDIFRDSGDGNHQAIKDRVINEALAPMRDGSLDRNFLLSLINKRKD